MLSGHDWVATSESVITPVMAPTQVLRGADDGVLFPAASSMESRVLDDWMPERRSRRLLQQTIEAIEAPCTLLDDRGEVVAVNRAWRLTADAQGLADAAHGLGRNYLLLCRRAAADGCPDAAVTAEGLESVLNGSWRSFHYKYEAASPGEMRRFALRAWRVREADKAYVAVAHELLETQLV